MTPTDSRDVVVNRFIVRGDGRFALVFNLTGVLGDIGSMNVRLPLYRNPGQEVPALTDFVHALSVLHGTVESLGAATGSEFSLIPAQNATGNWVKVVQRVPVRIKLDGSPETALLKTGMSAAVSVDTGHSQLDKMLGK